MRMLYRITFGSGLAWLNERIVETEEWQCEQDALDILIDQLELEGLTGLVISEAELERGDFQEDEYVVGGNHGRALLHHGTLLIEKLTEVAA